MALNSLTNPLQKQYQEFWNWFQKYQETFYQAVKTEQNIDEDFFSKLSPKLDAIKEGIFYLSGMLDEDTAELVLTADGSLLNIAFVEDLVETAPNLKDWKFTALKPAMENEDFTINMGDLSFGKHNIHFYPIEHSDYPDRVDLCFIYENFEEENVEESNNGIYLFLDNFLGELEFATQIDNVQIVSPHEVEPTQELIPISKLKAYLNWRNTEFVEKYEGLQYDTENDDYGTLEQEFESGDKLYAVIDTTLLNWDATASHPWMATITFKYEGVNGMPNENQYEKLELIHGEMMAALPDFEGYLMVCRVTSRNDRDVFLACKDFRKPSKVFYELSQKYGLEFEIEYQISKDKYWQALDYFRSFQDQ